MSKDEHTQVGIYALREVELRSVKERLRESAGKGAFRDKAGREPVTSIAKVESDRSRKNSRTKGNRAELDVAEMFARWCGEVVRRTPGSGGWSNAKFGVTGDLVCDKKEFPYHVEIKHREGFVLDDLVTGVRKDHNKSIVQWWKQCVESCPRVYVKRRSVGISLQNDEELEKEPLLVFRRNRQPWLVMMRRGGWSTPPAVGEAFFSLPYAPCPDVKVTLLDVFLDLESVPAGLKNHRREG